LAIRPSEVKNIPSSALGAHLVGRRRGAAAGPTLLVIGAIHGNEPAGVEAARAVLDRLDEHQAPLAGEVVVLVGNPVAMAQGRRFVERDLNRQWTAERVAEARARARAPEDHGRSDVEQAGLAGLADAIDEVIGSARGTVFALDLHTTSAEGLPFAILGETAADRHFAAAFPLPGIVGLQQALQGVLSLHLSARGCPALTIEGGQHHGAAARRNLEAAITLGLTAAGLAEAAALPGWQAAHDHLRAARGQLPHLVEVVSRHEVRPDAGFRMEPGFTNLQHTARGTLLAREGEAEIRAPFDGLLLLPLYQAQGTDGFFYGRELLAG
jgi:succinylglutamate desuccinylase